MTPPQTKFYWNLWNAAAKANRWHMENCRLQNAGLDQPMRSDLIAEVIQLAHARAEQDHRGVSMDDLRHGVHMRALQRDCGHDHITTREFGRIKVLLELMANPDDLNAMNEWLHPELEEKRRLMTRIGSAPAAYVQAICMARFKTRNWQSLKPGQMRSLAMTLANRKPAGGKPFSTRNEQRPAPQQHNEDPY